MEPIKFSECNVTFGEGQPEYKPLPAYLDKGEKGQAVTCWELSDDDLKKIAETKKIYLSQLTFHNPLQSIVLTVNKEDIFIDQKDDTK